METKSTTVIPLSAVIITYGELNTCLTFPGLASFIVADITAARQVAIEFINVIPDALDGYIAEINEWAGSAPLSFTHQEDDAFFFSAVPVYGCFMEPTEDITEFNNFVAQYNAD